MSHSQFHCTTRVHLDMHGLIFETSICYWQDQPGSRAPGHRPTDPPRAPPAPTRSADEAEAAATPAAGPTPLGGEERRAPHPGGPAGLPPTGKERRPLRSFRRRAPGSPARARRRARRGAATAGAHPPSEAGGDAPGTAPAAAIAAGAADVLEENATSRRARAPDRGTQTRGGALRGERGTRPRERRTALAGRAPRRPLAFPLGLSRIGCHPRRLAARGRHPPGPGTRPAPAPRATLTDPCGSRGRSAVTQPPSDGKAPSLGAENGANAADDTTGRAPYAAANAAALAPSEAAPRLRREATRTRDRPCLNTGHRRGSPGTGERGRAGPPGALADATRMASSIAKQNEPTASRANARQLLLAPTRTSALPRDDPTGKPLRRARGTPRRAPDGRCGSGSPEAPPPRPYEPAPCPSPLAWQASGTGRSRRGRPRTDPPAGPSPRPDAGARFSPFSASRTQETRSSLFPSHSLSRLPAGCGGRRGGAADERLEANARQNPRPKRRHASLSRAPAPKAAPARSPPLPEQSTRSLLQTNTKVTLLQTLQEPFEPTTARLPRAPDSYHDVTGGTEKQRLLRHLPSRRRDYWSTDRPTTRRQFPSEPGLTWPPLQRHARQRPPGDAQETGRPGGRRPPRVDLASAAPRGGRDLPAGTERRPSASGIAIPDGGICARVLGLTGGEPLAVQQDTQTSEWPSANGKR